MRTLKCEIAFHGDVINTTARLERLCSKLNEELIISEALYNLLPKSEQDEFVPIGEFPLKGKEIPMTVYGLSKQDHSTETKSPEKILEKVSG